jgi:hypothetical protein
VKVEGGLFSKTTVTSCECGVGVGVGNRKVKYVQLPYIHVQKYHDENHYFVQLVDTNNKNNNIFMKVIGLSFL